MQWTKAGKTKPSGARQGLRGQYLTKTGMNLQSDCYVRTMSQSTRCFHLVAVDNWLVHGTCTLEGLLVVEHSIRLTANEGSIPRRMQILSRIDIPEAR